MLKKPSAKRAQYTGLFHGARRACKARPDSAELDVFPWSTYIVYPGTTFLIQTFYLDHIPTPKT